MNICPICDKPLITSNEGFAGEHILAELQEDCPDGHYHFEFSYGSSIERISGVAWIGDWGDSIEDRLARHQARNLVIALNRLPSCEVMAIAS
jgi:hypothetical protein